MKKIISLLLITIYSTYSIACSTFFLNQNGKFYFGRNYDWVTGTGMVLVNARDVKKTSFLPEGGKQVSWTSKYGSVTFNQFGKEFPHGGMNEKGLVVELMWVDGTNYPNADQRPALSELQWIQYQLDNYTSVDEVIASDRLVRISREGSVPLHFLIADATGAAATIEFLDGKMIFHKGKELPYPVLTNTVYSDAVNRLKSRPTNEWVSFSDNSIKRFATACQMIQRFEKAPGNQNPVDFSFSILHNIAQGDYTKWRIVYDISGRQIHFVTNGAEKRKSLSLNDFDYSCNNAPRAFNLNKNVQGSISHYFTPLTFAQNKSIIQQSAKESETQFTLRNVIINGIAEYFNQVQCK